MAKIKPHKNALLLVEGVDDQHIIWALCSKFNIDVRSLENPEGGIFSVEDGKGYTNILKQINERFKTSDINTIGIIVDADVNLQNRWQSLSNKLTTLGFTCPETIENTGFITTNDNGKKVGVWIMPNNKVDGMIEDFMAFLIPKKDKLIDEVNNFLENIEEKGLNKYTTPLHKAKATIHTWLAAQKEPGSRMGVSITSKYLTTDEATCKLLFDWLKDLFN
jgi:hypothetical protein